LGVLGASGVSFKVRFELDAEGTTGKESCFCCEDILSFVVGGKGWTESTFASFTPFFPTIPDVTAVPNLVATTANAAAFRGAPNTTLPVGRTSTKRFMNYKLKIYLTVTCCG